MLNGSILGQMIKAEVLARPGLNVGDDAQLAMLCDAIAAAVVQHVQSSAVVTVAPGIVIAGTGGGPAPVVGSTTSPGTGTVA